MSVSFKKKLNLIGTWSLVWLSHSSPSFGQSIPRSSALDYDQAIIRLAVGLSSSLNQVDPLINPHLNTRCSKTVVVPKPQPKPQIKAYTCNSQGVISTSTTESSASLGDANTSISVWNNNDNLMLGAIRSGNDRGITNGMGLTVTHQIKDHEGLIFDLTSNLGSRLVAYDNSAYLKAQEELQRGEIVALGQSDITFGNKTPVQIADITRLKAAFEKGDRLYYRFGLGVEMKQTDPQKFVPALGLQSWWHHGLGIDEYQNISANGIPSETTKETRRLWPSVNEGSGIPGGGAPGGGGGGPGQGGTGGLGGIGGTGTVGVYGPSDGSGANLGEQMITTENVKNGIKADPTLQAMSKLSWIGQADIGMRTQIIGGKCELELEAGGFVVTEGSQILGPNSYLHVNAGLSGTVFKKKDGTPRVNAGASAGLLYFPTAGSPEDKSLGTIASLTLSSSHRVGKANNTLEPFIVLMIPGGRVTYQHVNDSDAIQRMGIRFNFR